jgi:hypothetical protein
MWIANLQVLEWGRLPRYLRAVLVIAILVVFAALGFWAHDLAPGLADGKCEQARVDLEVFRRRIAVLEGQLAVERSGVRSDSELQIERKTLEDLAGQVKTLQAEKIQLQEDLALFEKLASTEGNAPALTINGLRVEADAVPGQYRYRFLVAAQGGKKGQEFNARVQVIIALEQSGKRVMLVLPAVNDKDDPRFALTIRHFRRVDGTFLVPDGARPVAVEVRLLRAGATSASQRISL